MNNYNERIQHLTKQVNQITSTDGGGLKSILPKNINYKLVFMISLPILIIIFLIFQKSPFIMTKVTKNKKEVKQINFIKLFLILVIVGGAELAFYFFYLKKKNNTEFMP